MKRIYIDFSDIPFLLGSFSEQVVDKALGLDIEDEAMYLWGRLFATDIF